MDSQTIPSLSRFNRDLTQGIRWPNQSAEAVPAYGVVRLTDYDTGNSEHQVDKPDGSDGLYYVNGPVAVAASARGSSLTWDTPRMVLTNSAETLAVGDMVGPVDGQWYMSNAGTGYRVFAAPNVNDIAVVERISSGSGELRHGIVTAQLGCGYYTIELAEWAGGVDAATASGTGGSGSGTPCDPCGGR